jgi:hypothetical protein
MVLDNNISKIQRVKNIFSNDQEHGPNNVCGV